MRSRCHFLSLAKLPLTLGFAVFAGQHSVVLGSDPEIVPCNEPIIGCDSMESNPNACDAYGCEASTLFPGLTQLRGRMADSGVTFQNNLTQFYMGNTRGGIERDFHYSGHGDYVTNLDFGKLGVQQGLFLKLRAEHRFGESLAGATGSFLPPNLAADLPVLDDERLLLTNFLITQALSENFVLFAGKLDTLDGDLNAYAHGRGIRQFSNTAFIASPIALRTVPYSTLGTGFSYLMDMEPLFTFSVLNATDTADTDGFSELFAEGAVITAELRLPTNFFGLPGHQLIAGTWSSRDYVALDQDPRIILPQVPIARQSGSWSLYWNCDQALAGDAKKNWGYFARAGIADDDTNPIASFLSAGFGGDSNLRDDSGDSWGVGWFYADTSTQIAPFLSTAIGTVGNGQGIEMFYNMRCRKRLTITPDIQYLSPPRRSANDALVAGIRANLVF